MNIKNISQGKDKEKLFLLGNEAAVRGALESGVSIASWDIADPSKGSLSGR